MTNITRKGSTNPLTLTGFIQIFRGTIYGDRFTGQGLEALYTFFNDLGDAEQIEMDVSSFCAEFNEFYSVERALKMLGYRTIEELHQKTYVVELANGGVFIECINRVK